MVVFPNCKINLGLNIVGKRPDGYHNLETVFFPLRLTDALEIIPVKNIEPGAASASTAMLSTSGIAVTANPKDNICLKACQILQNDFRDRISSMNIHLHKAVPAGAGLGGGSADGTFTLKLLNKIFRLNLSNSQLEYYAGLLGSDCPFFVINKPCFATGRGEILKEIDLDLSAYKIILIHPGIHINTALAFSRLNPAVSARPISEIIRQPIASWKKDLKNDFEKNVFDEYPEIATIKSRLYENGAVYASMSGSGSTVFGIFHQAENPVLHFPAHYFIHAESVSQDHT